MRSTSPDSTSSVTIASIGMPCSIIVRDERVVDRRERGREHLLDAEVEHRLLHRRELDAALPQTADRLRHREHAGERAAGGVAVHADGGDEADAFLVAAAHLGSEHARRDHAAVAGRIEPSEAERVAARDDHARVRLGRERQQRDDVVGDEDADHVGVVRRFEVVRLEAVGHCLLSRLVAAHAHDRCAAAVAQVERPRTALVAVADHRDLLVRDRRRGRRRARSRWWSQERRLLGQAHLRVRAGDDALQVTDPDAVADRVGDADHRVAVLVDAPRDRPASNSRRSARRRRATVPRHWPCHMPSKPW